MANKINSPAKANGNGAISAEALPQTAGAAPASAEAPRQSDRKNDFLSDGYVAKKTVSHT